MAYNNHSNSSNQSNNDRTTALIPNSVLFNRKGNVNSIPRCPLSGKDAPEVDYKNIGLLGQYISEKGRILPSRLTGISAPMQRKLKRAIKKARMLALLPFAAS